MTNATLTQGTTTWQIEPTHSEIGFAIKHMMVTNVKGHFGQFAATVQIDEDDVTRSSIAAVIDVDSINTKVDARDNHLRSADFFDVASHPKMTFVSERVERVGDGELKVFGNLTIRGVSKPVVLNTELTGRGRDPWGNERIGFVATTKIDRREFGLGWNQVLETGGILVGDDVKITIEAQLVPAA